MLAVICAALCVAWLALFYGLFVTINLVRVAFRRQSLSLAQYRRAW